MDRTSTRSLNTQGEDHMGWSSREDSWSREKDLLLITCLLSAESSVSLRVSHGRLDVMTDISWHRVRVS